MPKSKEIKQEEAIMHNKTHDRLTIQQKITKLDKKFGKDKGATKERARLTKQLAKSET